MSMSLYVWSTPVITDADEAARLLNLEDESVFEPSDRLCRFFRRAARALSIARRADGSGARRWCNPLGRRAAGVRATRLSQRAMGSTRRGRRRDRRTRPETRARHLRPQGPGFHTSAEDEAVTYRPGTGEFLRGLALALFGVLLSAIAWKLSVPVLTWVLVFVGGFVAVVAVVSLLATAHARFGARATP